MKKKKSKFLIIASVLLLTACGENEMNNQNDQPQQLVDPEITAEDVLTQEYEIYPNPQDITYQNKSFVLQKDINVVVEENIDVYTQRKLQSLLTMKSTRAHRDDTITDGGNPSILLGIYQSQGVVDTYLHSVDLSYLATENDAYYLDIQEKQIVILGKDSDACYYALSTLSFIFEQSHRTLRSLTIKDYSDSTYRGFIEGYYGIPWTSEERMELMRFGSKFKSNIYIYAPKDDSYHSTNWRGLYTTNDFEQLKKQIEVGRETKTRFAWSIHPFMNQPITKANYDTSLQDVIRKFSQVYDAGVRQFVISADDVSTDGVSFQEYGALHKKLLNDVVSWCERKGDCYPLIFVPSAYCSASNTVLRVEIDAYFTGLMDGLDESVEIMWTGHGVTSAVSTGDFDVFSQYTNGRKAFMWLNWPVNDYATSRLLLSKAEILDKPYLDEEVEFTGIVTNPMPQAEASKLSIFAVCDYTWNTKKFDVDQSYQDSFKYVEEKETDSFYEIAQHLANTTLYEGKYFEESTELKQLITNYDYMISHQFDATKRIEDLMAYFDRLMTACDTFLKNAANRKLVDSIAPWVEAIHDTAFCSKAYLKIVKLADTVDINVLKEQFNEIDETYQRLLNHKAPVLNTVTYNYDLRKVDVGVVVLTPFMNRMRQEAKMILGDVIITYQGFTSIYQGSLDLISDGDDSTYCWFGSAPSSSAFVRLDFRKEVEIKDIRVLFGNANGNGDFMNGVIRYSLDGVNFTTIQSLTGSLTIVDLRDAPIMARYLDIYNTGTETWVSIKDISINRISDDQVKISYNAGVADEGLPIVDSQAHPVEHMIDGDPTTYTWFDWHSPAGSYIVLDYRSSQTVRNIYLYQGVDEHPGDYFESVSFFYSLDGETYFPIGEATYEDQKDIFIDLSSSLIEARYIKVVSNHRNSNGVTIKEFGINQA